MPEANLQATVGRLGETVSGIRETLRTQRLDLRVKAEERLPMLQKAPRIGSAGQQFGQFQFGQAGILEEVRQKGLVETVRAKVPALGSRGSVRGQAGILEEVREKGLAATLRERVPALPAHESGAHRAGNIAGINSEQPPRVPTKIRF